MVSGKQDVPEQAVMLQQSMKNMKMNLCINLILLLQIYKVFVVFITFATF